MGTKKGGGWIEYRKCQNCNGTGKVDQEEIKGASISVVKVNCSLCSGKGGFEKTGTIK